MKLPVASFRLPVVLSCQRGLASRRWARWIPAFAGMTLLAACAQPTAMTPQVSREEIAQERATQEQMAHGTAQQDFDEASFSRTDMEPMKERLSKIVSKLAPPATNLCRELNGPEANCNMHVVLSAKGKGLNAHADGKQIVIYPAMVEFAKNDNHLAFILAHEYTHHMMSHVQATQQNVTGGALLGTLADLLAASQGVNTQGQFGQLGAQTALLSYSPEFEHEADYIGLYVLARAGFDYAQAPGFWRDMSRNNPKGIYNRTTHPTTPERFVMMNKTIEEIERKKAAGQKLLPNIRPQES